MAIFLSIFSKLAAAGVKATATPHMQIPLDNKVSAVGVQKFLGFSDPTDIRQIKDAKRKAEVLNNQSFFNYIYTKCDCKKEVLSFSALKAAIAYCTFKVDVAKNESRELSADEREKISGFFKKIAKLPQEQFDRKALLGGKIALQRVLSPELDALLSQQEKSPHLQEDMQHQLNISIAKAKLSIKLGYGVTVAKNGANGAQIIKDLEGKPVGVFKSAPKLKWYQVGERLKQRFGQARLLNKKDELAQQFAEVAAHRFDDVFGFHLAPAAAMVKLSKKEGAFLAFLGGYQELKDCEKKLQARNTYDPNEKVLWQRMCLYNFLIGNLDPHNENIFVRMYKQGHLNEVRMIDHGNSFIEYNPAAWGAKGNQGHWGTYKISKEAFEPEVLDFIKNQLTSEKLESFVQQMGSSREKFWSVRMDQLMRDRLQLLRDGILSGSISNPDQLSQIHLHADFSKHLIAKPHDSLDMSVIADKTIKNDWTLLDKR
jgi:hypothetical protein